VSLYKVIFLGMTVAGPEEEARLITGLQKKFNLTPERAERLLQRVPIVIKKGVSKEEMEKYVKAFEQIGGRVRVETEEELAAELPKTSAESETERKPYMGRMITCPQCGFEQPETDECLKCGIVISKFSYQQKAVGKTGGVFPERLPEDQYVPWESGEGFVSVFFRTVWDALFSPTRFFRKVGSGEGYLSSLVFGVITGIIGFGGGLLWQWYFLSRWLPFRMFPDLPYRLYFTVLTIAIPLIVIASLLFVSIVIHFCLTMVGGNRKGFQTTFRVVAYSFSGQLFGIIPLIGGTIGSIYIFILNIIGIREGHGISTGRAVLAIFLPVIVGIGVAILLVIFKSLVFGRLGFFVGAGA
jgi:hypothetical protein